MTEPIKVGDLVMVVRGHACIVARIGGIPFTVLAFMPQIGGGWHCSVCNERDIAQSDLIGARLLRHADHGIPLSWLKRIPPLAELEGEQRKEGVEA